MRTSDMKRRHKELTEMAYRASVNNNKEFEDSALKKADEIKKRIEKIESENNRNFNG